MRSTKTMSFVIRQFARFRFFIVKFGAFFSMANFITLILILFANMGVILTWYWLLVVYVSMGVAGLVLVFVLERMGSWDVEFLQRWKMENKKLFLQQSELNAVNIELMRRKTNDQLAEKKKSLLDGWK